MEVRYMQYYIFTVDNIVSIRAVDIASWFILENYVLFS